MSIENVLAARKALVESLDGQFTLLGNVLATVCDEIVVHHRAIEALRLNGQGDLFACLGQANTQYNQDSGCRREWEEFEHMTPEEWRKQCNR